MAYAQRPRSSSGGGSSSSSSHAAVRVLLSQLYLTWASSKENIQQIDAAVQAALAAAKQGPAPAAATTASSSRSSGASASLRGDADEACGGDAGSCGSGAAATVADPAAVAAAAKATVWYADPLDGLDLHSRVGSSTSKDATTSRSPPRSLSPPATPPYRHTRAEEQAAAAAAVVAAQSGLGPHFLGVDEIDFAHHRLGSPGVTPSSPHARPVVDPMAPLPHGHASSPAATTTTSSTAMAGTTTTAAAATTSTSPLRASSPSGTSSSGSNSALLGLGEAAAMMTAAVGDVATVAGSGGSSSSRDGHVTGRVMHTSRSYSMLSPADAKRASLHDIRVFYTLGLSRGLAETANEAELTALNELVTSSNSGSSGDGNSSDSNRSGSSGGGAAGKADATTLQRATFDRVSLSVFSVPAWLKELLFETIAQHSGLAPATTDTLTPAQVSHFYHDVYARLTPTRRLFELIHGSLAVAAAGVAASGNNNASGDDEAAAAAAAAKQRSSTPAADDKNNNDDDRSDDTKRRSGGSQDEHLTLEHFKNMTRYLVASHPGLDFLKQPEFQEYYCRTVAIRIVYCLERQQSGKVTWRDFDRSNLPDKMMLLDSVDVNQVLDYFSYEHFYVLYCKFWELDTDRDLLVDFDDLCHYGQGSLVPSVIRRVVDGHGRPLRSGVVGKLDYEDFVYFCLSEEDKNMDPAVLYWFRVLDVDGDGVLSGYELSLFYRENQQRLLEYSGGGGSGNNGGDGGNGGGDGEINYEDAMCQMLDMLGFDRVQARHVGVTLGDLRACPTPANFFNMIFNAQKFMQFERRDPFYERQQKLWPEKTDWDRFARAEYDRMAAEAQ